MVALRIEMADKLWITVEVGLTPEKHMLIMERCRRWTLTAEEVESADIYNQKAGEALMYYLQMANPKIANYVALKWTWL